MENKRKNIYITVFVITTIVAACAAVYFAIKLSTDTKNFEERLNELSSKVEETTENNVNEEESKEDNTQEEVKDDNENQETLVEKYVVPGVDVKKCLNESNDFIYESEIVSDTLLGITITRNNDKRSVNVVYNTDLLKQYYIVDKKSNDEGIYDNVTINNFSGEVQEIYITSLSGLSVGEEFALFLMKNGTVEYIPLYDAFKNDTLKSYGKIQGVSDVVRVTQVERRNGPTSCKVPVAVKEDGSFYDLRELLLDKVTTF